MLDRLPNVLLRAEGLALFGAALALYLDADFSVLALVLLFLVPDLSFAAYLAGPRVGALVYDTLHTEVLPLVLIAAGVLADSRVLVQVSLIWLAHIGFDRLLGYGLKYPTEFGDTHLGRLAERSGGTAD
jgi:Domain of unknown function (DUF4260)